MADTYGERADRHRLMGFAASAVAALERIAAGVERLARIEARLDEMEARLDRRFVDADNKCSCGKDFTDHTNDEMVECIRRVAERA